MRSRSGLEHAGVALGAAAEGVWSGGLAAALTGASAAFLIVFAGVTVLVAAQLARRFSAGEGRERAARALAMTLILVAAAVLLVAGRAWAHPSPLWLVARDFVYAGGLVLLGLHLGRESQTPETAVRRAIRGFGLLCAVLTIAAVAGSAPGWAPWALVAALLVGGLLVAIVRYRALTDLVDPVERLPAWPWLLAVTGAVLIVIAVGALLSQVLRVETVLGALSVLAGVLRYGLDGLAYLIGYAADGLVRAIAALLSMLHLHTWHIVQRPRAVPTPTVFRRLSSPNLKVWRGSRLMFTAVGALVAVVVSFTLVAVALRRFRREPPEEVMVVEEREALASLRSAAGAFAARLGRRLRRRLASRRRGPGTPAELVRRRYAELERRLARAGRPRLPGVTVRDHLAAVAMAVASAVASAGTVAPGSAQVAPPQAAPPHDTQPQAVPPPLALAAELAAVYELARYSAHTVDTTEARRFEALARGFGA